MTDFICPVKSNSVRLTSPYGYRIHPIRKVKAMHGGVDLVCSKEKHPPIVASSDGTVRLVKDTGNTGYGKYIIIRHNINGKIFETVYAHLKSVGVKVGQKVKQGEIVGVMGSTGGSTGSHLHYEVHNQPYNYGGGKYPSSVDPLKYVSLTDTPNNTPNNTNNNTLKQPTISSNKEEINLSKITVKDMSIQTLKDSAYITIKNAKDKGLIHDQKWVDQAKNGTLTIADLLGLYIHIENKKNGLIK